ncbi:hypothetical protein ACCD10_00790 [Pseudomonas sp. Pseusp122]|uniref:hypothetical protein n=1 Tax=unclassified Pseudomonas TaxID=196821 RepID=UPI0039A48470
MVRATNTGLRNAEMVDIALRAGVVAILVNSAMLMVADRSGLITARGGLLKLLTGWVILAIDQSGHAPWALWIGAVARTYAFQSGFHIVVGLFMACLFVKLAAGRLENDAWRTALAAAVVVWLVNALIILPALGEGVAGQRTLTLIGILYFAVAHTAFFLTLALDARRRMRRLPR